jgi:hypothetical protein
MKAVLRKICSPVLNIFESGNEEFIYRPSHRKILIAVGVLFFILAGAAISISVSVEQYAGLMPGSVFLIAGLVCEIVAFLGTDKAVAKMWKSK